MKIVCNIITDKVRDLAKQLNKSESHTCNLISVWQSIYNTSEYPTLAQLKNHISRFADEVEETELAIPNYKTEGFAEGEPLAATDKNGEITLRILPKDNPIGYFYDYISGALENTTSQQKKKVFELLEQRGYPMSKVKQILNTTKEIYQFLLWHEMSHIQNDDRSVYWKNGDDYLTDDKIEIETRATIDALKKAEKWKSSHPSKSTGFIPHPIQMTNLGAENGTRTVQVSNEWKEPLLLTLDRQLGGNLTKEEKASIIDQINKIINATSVINIHAGSRENASLSNFAARPFVVDFSTIPFSNGVKQYYAQSIEQAFQWAKFMYASLIYRNEDGTWRESKRVADLTSAAYEVTKTKTPYDAKSKGKAFRLTPEELKYWDKAAPQVMKFLMKVSFSQDPNALQALLSTGNAYLTHMSTQQKSMTPQQLEKAKKDDRWIDEMPKLLMEVRDDFKKIYEAKDEKKEEKKGDGQEGSDKASQQPAQQQRIDINTISNKSAAYGVEIIPGGSAALKSNYAAWQQQHPEGIVAYRVNFSKYATPEEANAGRIGNPFSENTRGKDTVQQFYEWLTTGNNFGNAKASEEYRQAIIQKILSTPENAPILYYTELNRPSHATVIGYLVNNKQLLQHMYRTPASTSFVPNTDNIDSQDFEEFVASNSNFDVDFEAIEQSMQESGQPDTDDKANDVNDIPDVGLDVVQIDEDNPMRKLANDFTAQEREDRVTMLARNFSNIVSQAVQERIQETADAITEEMNKENPNEGELARLYDRAMLFNDSVKGRRAVMQDITIYEIFNRMKQEIESYLEMTPEELDEDYGEGRGEYMLNAYRKVLDNWQPLLEEACILIEGAENIRVVIDKHDRSNGTTSEKVVGGIIQDSSEDEDKNEENFGDDEEGNRADGNGGWSFKVRFVDPITSLSKGIKNILSNIKKIGFDGEPEVDDLGNIRYVNGEYAHSCLINDLCKMVDPDDFSVKQDDGSYTFPALEALLPKYPWVSQVISALQVEPSLIGAFYADFRKDFIPYWMQYYDENDGKWKTIALNQAVALDSTISRITTNYDQGNILDEDSIYKSGNKISVESANKGVDISNEALSLLREFDEDDYDAITDKVAKGLRMLGLDSNKHVISNLLTSTDGVISLEKVVNAMRNIFDGVQDMPESSHLITYFSDDYRTIAEEIGLVSELDNVQSFRNGDKTYYSYSAPNYLDTMFKTFKDDERRPSYLQDQFGKYDWFKNQQTGEWMSEWLNLLENDEDVRDQLMLKELLDIRDSAGRPTKYENWTPTQIKNAFIREYFSVGYNKASKKQFAWYNLPIFSDSPICKFIKFLRYTDNYREQLLPLFNKVVKQELGRISKVLQRRELYASPISNYDKNGDKFHFFPELNDGNFLQEAGELIADEDFEGLDKLINTRLEEIMDTNFEEFLNTNFTDTSYEALKQSLLSDGVITSESQFEDALEEYFWNQAYATTQIIELTTTDLAFYKNDVDFQKRYKEVYAAGTKLNTNTQYGKKTEKTLYLADQIITSSGYQDIRKSLNRAVKLGHIQSFDRDNILDKFKNINVADAQAYRNPKSLRAVLDMMGAWTPEMQQAMDKFDPKNPNNKEGAGNWTMADFNIVWQTIKPFVFTQIEKPDGLGGSIKVPHQNKNSEFLLLSMYSMIAGATGKSAKLQAINRFMDDHDIDVVQFESAVKAGGQGKIDLSYSPKKLSNWINNLTANQLSQLENAAEKALGKDYAKASDFDKFKAGNDYLLDHDQISQEEYNDRFEAIEPLEEEVYSILEKHSLDEDGNFVPEVIHEIPYTDYMIQQPTPEHLFDHRAVFGSQFRNLIISDMPDDPNFRVKVNGKELTKQQVIDLYQSNIVENLLDDWRKVKGKFTNIEALQKAMLDTVRGTSKFGRDMLSALQIVTITNPLTMKEEKVFNIPLDNPSTTLKIQELITSMFKNAITKQDIKGGACILVSNFGLTKELNIIHGDDGSIQGIECYLPAYSKQFYEPLMTKADDGSYYLDVEKLPMDLRKIIGYRIPTEDKYSMAPLIIKGFLPQQNGSAIMLPADITQIAGSDFDVDKMFLMIPEFYVHKYDKVKARKDFAKMNAVFRAAMAPFSETELAEETLAEDINDFNVWYEDNKEKYKYDTPKVGKIKYSMDKSAHEQTGNPVLKRQKRNNMLINIAWGILTNPDTAEKIHNPGSFDKAKIAARIASIVRDPKMVSDFAQAYGIIPAQEEGLVRREETADALTKDKLIKVRDLLLKMSREGKLDELNDFIKDHRRNRSQLTVDTFIYNHRQNMTGAALIGMYANNTTMQAKYQATNLSIKDDFTFVINGRVIKSLHDIMSPLGERISKNCANFSAASVDNVKDPVLADLMQNTKTANIAGFMLRAGMSIEEIGLLFSQPVIRRCIEATGSLETLKEFIDNMAADLASKGGGVNTEIQLMNFTSEDLLMNTLNEFKSGVTLEEYKDFLAKQIQVGLLMKHIMNIAQDLSDLTHISRADSPSKGSIAPSIAGAKVQVQEVNLYTRKADSQFFTLSGIRDIMKNDYLSADMSEDELREKILKGKMPMLQAFYSLGIELGTRVMSQYFSQTTEFSDELVEQIFDNSPRGVVKKEVLDTFYSEMIEFALSKTTLLGDDSKHTFDEKRDYYLYDFPARFLDTLANNPDIAKLNVIRKLEVENGDIIMRRSGRMTPKQRDSLMRDFDVLLNSDPVSQKLAIDLFMYSYYKDGFKFGPNSFGSLFSSTFIASFPEFVNTLRELKYDMKKGTYFDNYLEQFYANHYNTPGLIKTLSEYADVETTPDGKIAVASKQVLNTNVLYKGKARSFQLINYLGTLYTLSLDGGTRAIYEPAVILTAKQQGKRGVKYNANMSIHEMEGIETDEAKVKANANVGNTAQSIDDEAFQFIETDDSFRGFEGMDFDALDQGLAQAETYSEEDGQSELKEPLC